MVKQQHNVDSAPASNTQSDPPELDKGFSYTHPDFPGTDDGFPDVVENQQMRQKGWSPQKFQQFDSYITDESYVGLECVIRMEDVETD